MSIWLLQLSPPSSAADAPGATAVVPIFAGKVGESGGDLISPDFTPPDNSLVVMVTFGVEDDYDVSQMRPLHNMSGTLTERLSLSLTGASRVAAKVWTIPVSKGVVSAAGFAYPDSQSVKGRILILFAVTGYDTADPIGVSVVNSALGDGDGAMVLPRNPDPRSVVIAGRILDVDTNEDAAATPGVGWTELGDESVFERAGLQVQYRIGDTSPNIAWGSVNANKAKNQQCGGFAIEIRPSAPAAPHVKSMAGSP